MWLDSPAKVAERQTNYARPTVREGVTLTRAGAVKAVQAAADIDLSNQMVVNVGAQAASFRMQPMRRAPLAAVADTLQYESSDANIVAVSGQAGAQTLQATGKLGNAYITVRDQTGAAVEKFSFLTAAPRQRVLVLGPQSNGDIANAVVGLAAGASAAYNNSGFWTFQDTQLLSGSDAQGQPVAKVGVGSLISRDNNQTGYSALLLMNSSDQAAALQNLIQSSDKPSYDAVYLPSLNLMFAATPANRLAQGSSLVPAPGVTARGTVAVELGRMLGQGDFGKYFDYGGRLTSLPVAGSRDPQQMDVNMPGQLVPSGKSFRSVRLANGKTLDFASYLAGGALGSPAKGFVADYAYVPKGSSLSALSDDDKKGVSCVFDVQVSVLPTYTALGGSIHLNLGGEISWNDNGPDFQLESQPQASLGYAQLEVDGEPASFGVRCSLTLVKIPLNAVGLPLLGRVDVNVPINAVFEISLALDPGAMGVSGVGGASVAKYTGPNVNVGSGADPTKPGKILAGYSNGTFLNPSDSGNSDVGTSHNVVPRAVEGTNGGKNQITVFLGVSAGLQLELVIKVLSVEVASVTADIVEIPFGLQYVSSETVDAVARTVTSTQRSLALHFAPVVAPTLSINVPWISVSLQLFDFTLVDVNLPLASWNTTQTQPLAAAATTISLPTGWFYGGGGGAGQILDTPDTVTITNWFVPGYDSGLAPLRLSFKNGQVSDSIRMPRDGSALVFNKKGIASGQYTLQQQLGPNGNWFATAAVLDFGYGGGP